MVIFLGEAKKKGRPEAACFVAAVLLG